MPASVDPTLETPRLTLEPITRGDVGPLHALLLEPAVRRYLLDGVEISRAWVEDAVLESESDFRTHGFGLWRIRARSEDGALVGLTGLRRFPGASEPQLLYALAPRFWGRGYATEAAAAVVRHAFDDLGFRRILASTDSPNLDSLRVMERLGMRFLEAGLMERHRLVFYTLTREAWQRGCSPGSQSAASTSSSAASRRR